MNQTGFIVNGKIIFNESSNHDEFHFYGFIVEGKDKGKNFIWKVSKSCIYIFVKESKIEKYLHYYSNDYSSDKNKEKFFNPNFEKEKYYKVVFPNREKLNHFVYNEPSLNYDDIQENDVNFLNRFLNDNGIKGYVEFLANGESIQETVFFHDPPLQKKITFQLPKLNFLSIDIETSGLNPEVDELYSVAVYGNYWREDTKEIFQKVLMVGEQEDSSRTQYFKNEEALLKKLTEWIQVYNPHVFVGWNVVGFDFKFLIKKYQQYDLPINWGIHKLPLQAIESQDKKKYTVTIAGRIILEGMFLFKNLYHEKFESYKLENISQEVLATGKTIEEDGKEKTQKINHLFQNNKEELAIYNLQDTKLVYDLIEKTKLFQIELYCYLITGNFIEKSFSVLDVVENLYLKIMHENKITCFKKENHKKVNIVFPLSNYSSGFHQNVIQYSFKDFNSAIVKNYSIDPVAMKLARIDNQNVIFEKSIENIHYHAEFSLLPKIFIFLEKIVKNSDNSFLHKAVEQTKKNIFKALELEYCRFSLHGIYESIIKNKKFIIDKTVSFLQGKGIKIICWDLNSIYIDFASIQHLEKNQQQQISFLVKEHWDKHFQQEFKRQSYLIFSKQEDYKYFFLQQQQIHYRENEQVHFNAFIEKKGKINYLDSVKKKKSEPKIVAYISKFLLENIFNRISVEELEKKIIDLEKELKNGQLDRELILTKKINRNKPDDEYQELIEQYRSHFNLFPYRIFYIVIDANYKKYQLCDKNKILPNEKLNSQINSQKIDYDYYLNRYILIAAKKILVNSPYEKCLQYLDPKNKGQTSLF